MQPELKAMIARVAGALPDERLHDWGNIVQVVLLSDEQLGRLHVRVKDLLMAAYRVRDNEKEALAQHYWQGQAAALTEVEDLIRKLR